MTIKYHLGKLSVAALCMTSLLTMTSCEDFLDTEDLTRKDSSNFPKTEADAQSALAAIYDELREMTPGEDGQSFFMTSELLSDDRFGGGGPDDRRMQAVDKMMKADENMFSDVWKQNYRGIYRANYMLEHVDAIDALDEATKAKYKGEAYFLRAYFYFDLCRLFGTVPMSTSTQVENTPRASSEELYGLIASDLDTAIGLLPNKKYDPAVNAELGHATKWAAEALLARVYLFYTGYYGQSSLPGVSKESVISYLDDCINNSGHALLSDFRNLWPYTNAYTQNDYDFVKDQGLLWAGNEGENVEAVFTIRYSTKASWDAGNPWVNNEICLYSTPREGGNGLEANYPFGFGWGVGTVNSRTYEEWPAGDMRRDASIMSVEKEMPNYTWGNDKQMNETGYWQKKYAAINCHTEDGESVNFSQMLYPEINTDYQLNNIEDVMVIRFADVLLMASELKQDAGPLNQVRARAGLEPVAYSDQALRNERRWELAFEAVRYWDLLRWGVAEEVLATQDGVNVKDNLADNKMNFSNIKERIQATKGLMPLPKKQIDLSNGVLEQNPGWGNESLYQN